MYLTKVKFLKDRYPAVDAYPFNLSLVRDNDEVNLDRQITFFVGENGTGKSTLLRAICLKAGVHIWQFSKGRRYEVNQHQADLYKCLDLIWREDPVPGAYFGSQTFQDFSAILDEWAAADPGILNYFGGSSLVTKSHGQSLMAYFKSLYQVKGIYFLDEPETALSPKSQLELLATLRQHGRAGHAQFIIATHSPILLACPGARIYNFDVMPLQTIDYEATGHYQIYRDFLNRPQEYLT